MTKVISFINLKGGVGKTTSAVNIAAAFAKSGKRVLIIDLDMQGNTTKHLGVKHPEYIIGGAMLGEHQLMSYPILKNLELVACDKTFSSIEVKLNDDAHTDLRMEVGIENILLNLINKTKGYELIVLDCPPSLNFITLNALAASDFVFSPLEPQEFSLDGVNSVLSIIESIKKRINTKIKLGGLFFARYDSRRTLSKDISNDVRQLSNNALLNTIIRSNVSLAEAPSLGQDIFTYEPKSTGAKEYASLFEEINSIVFGTKPSKKKPNNTKKETENISSISNKFQEYLDNE